MAWVTDSLNAIESISKSQKVLEPVVGAIVTEVRLVPNRSGRTKPELVLEGTSVKV